MNLALCEVLEPVAPNVGDSGTSVRTGRQKIIDYVNRAQRLLISRLDSKGTVWPACVPVAREIFSLPPEFLEVRSIMVDGHPAIQRDQYFEGRSNVGHRGEHSHWQHYCHGYELFDLGDGWATPQLLPQIQQGHLAFSCASDADAGKIITARIQNSYGDWVSEQITLLNDQQMAATQSDCYDVRFVSKPLTMGNINVFYIAPDATYSLQARYGPSVTAPSYRRKRLPKHQHARAQCGHTIKIMGKLRYLPALDDGDQLLIGNLDAIIWAVKAVTAQTIGDTDNYHGYLNNAVEELLLELRDDESEATVSPIEVQTGVSFNSRRNHRMWH